MLWVGTVVLVLGLAFFLKYAFDNDWINEPVRVGLGVAAGLSLVWAGHRFVRSGYRAYGQILTGGAYCDVSRHHAAFPTTATDARQRSCCWWL
jgi:uncharacterized membrane protein